MPVLVVDGNNLVGRQTHTHLGLQAPDGTYTGALHGSIISLNAFIRGRGFTGIFVVFDEGRPDFRRELVPTYKIDRPGSYYTEYSLDDLLAPRRCTPRECLTQGRHVSLLKAYVKEASKKTGAAHAMEFGLGLAPTEEDEKRAQFLKEYRAQLPLVEEILPMLGINTIRVPGWEGDDVIAWIVRYLVEDDDVVIVTTDKDMIQLVNGRVRLFRPGVFKNPDELITKPDWYYLPRRAMVGDKGDKIPGVHGIGEKKAQDVIDAAIESRGNFVKPWQFIDYIASMERKGKILERLYDERARVLANMLCMDLRLTPKLVARSLNQERDIVRGRIDFDGLRAVTRRFKMRQVGADLRFIVGNFRGATAEWRME